MVNTDRTLWSLQNGGQTIALSPDMPIDYLRAAGTTGLGVAPTLLTISGSVAGGGTFQRSRRDVRTVVAPVVTYGLSRGDVETKLRALVRLLDDQYTSPRLVATYPDGRVFDAEAHYAGGADHQWGSADTDGRTYCRWVLQLKCPDPYFTSRVTSQATVGGSSGRGLLRPGGSLTQLRLSSGQALGTVAVNNPGDVEAWPTWRVQGPGSRFTAQRAVDGAAFTLAWRFDASNPIVVDTRAKTALDSNGVNVYPGMVGAPLLFSLPPGLSTVQMNLLDADATSLVTLSFAERRELVF